MKREIELRFYPIKKRMVEDMLHDKGFIREEKPYTMVRYVYDLAPDKFLRIRGIRGKPGITAEIKERRYKSIDNLDLGVFEVPFSRLFNPDASITYVRDFLKEIGLSPSSFQVTKRTVYKKFGSPYTFSIDEWPHLLPLLEIEYSNKSTLKNEDKEKNMSSFIQRNLGPIKELLVDKDIVEIYMKKYKITREQFLSLKELDFTGESKYQIQHLSKYTS